MYLCPLIKNQSETKKLIVITKNTKGHNIRTARHLQEHQNHVNQDFLDLPIQGYWKRDVFPSGRNRIAEMQLI